MTQALIFEGWMAQVLGLLLIAALLSRRDQSTANRLLAFGLLCAVYRQSMLTLQLSEVLVRYPILARTSFPVQMLGLPSFYLYVKALTTPGFRIERREAVHLIPFGIGLALFNQAQYFQLAVKVVAVLPYLILAHLQVRAFAAQSRNFVSNFDFLKLSWLRTLLTGVYAMLAVDALDVATGPSIRVWLLIPSVGLIGLLTLAYFSLRVSPVFAREAIERRPDITEIAEREADQKKEASPATDDQLDRQTARLSEVLEQQKLYLNPELRLSDLATALGIRPYRVSEILNRGMQTNFYDLVNRYRISKAKELLLAPDSSHFNLLGIAMESGFKSKSVFNDVFKKSTGMTPSQFRNGKPSELRNSDI